MNTVLENVAKIVQTKNELKSILQAVGQTPTDDFNTYPDLFTDALEAMSNTADDINGE